MYIQKILLMVLLSPLFIVLSILAIPLALVVGFETLTGIRLP